MFSLEILAVGLLVFLARVVDVSLGTLRVMFLVQGRSALAFLLGFCEIVVWVTVVTAVIQNVREKPVLGIFFALGFATGNVVGIAAERKLALGTLILKVITRRAGQKIADRLRRDGLRVTTFEGQGMRGPVTELYIVCRRRQMATILAVVREEDREAFYITESAREVSQPPEPLGEAGGGGLSSLKKK